VGEFRAVIVALLLLSSILIASPGIETVRAAQDSWATMEPMPTERAWLGVAVVDGKIYAIGGANPSGALNTTEEFDPATDTWTTKTSKPTPDHAFGTAVWQNKIYCISGGVNEVYDPATDIWESKTPMPTSRKGLDANVVDDKIYLIGGTWDDPSTDDPYDDASNKTEVYDASTDTWSTATPLPTPVWSYASAVVDNKIYVIGGSGYIIYPGDMLMPHLFDLTQIYDPATDTWSLGDPIPNLGFALFAAGATTGVFAPKRIYVIGGATTVGTNQIYDPETDTWTYGADLPTPRYMLAVAVVNDRIYALGGVTGPSTSMGPYYAVNEQYTPIGYIPEFPSWTPMLLVLVVFSVAVVIYRRRLPQTN